MSFATPAPIITPTVSFPDDEQVHSLPLDASPRTAQFSSTNIQKSQHISSEKKLDHEALAVPHDAHELAWRKLQQRLKSETRRQILSKLKEVPGPLTVPARKLSRDGVHFVSPYPSPAIFKFDEEFDFAVEQGENEGEKDGEKVERMDEEDGLSGSIAK